MFNIRNSYKNMQVATSSNKNHFARVDESEQKRAPVKSNGKHLRQRREMQNIGKGKRALVKPEGSTYAGARSAHSIHGKEKSLNKLYKLVASGVRVSYENPTYAR